ncbi:MAG: phosphotyrosine protein phosphatase [Oceanospirillales bacterium LUC14_002_19_P2]|nr:MAG: phosphotyrosine protein phosphatase [Oceanospirillales bacterium LUC14_002_19_P2]
MRILFVCLGNICRSPTAQVVFERVVEQAGLSDQITVDSAGTSACHAGETPDKRAIDAASHRGYRMSHIRSRQVRAEDFDRFDLVLAMDKANLQALLSCCPASSQYKVRLFLDYEGSVQAEVPDPYYGGKDGFETVLDLIEEASQALLSSLKPRLEGAA